MCKQPLYLYSLSMGLHNIHKFKYQEYYKALKCNLLYKMKFESGGMDSLVSNRCITCSHPQQSYPDMMSKKDHKADKIFISFRLLLNLCHKQAYMLLSRFCKIINKKGRHLSSSMFCRLISKAHQAHYNFNRDSHIQTKALARTNQVYPK